MNREADTHTFAIQNSSGCKIHGSTKPKYYAEGKLAGPKDRKQMHVEAALRRLLPKASAANSVFSRPREIKSGPCKLCICQNGAGLLICLHVAPRHMQNAVLPLLRPLCDWWGRAERLGLISTQCWKYQPTTRRSGRWVFLLRETTCLGNNVLRGAVAKWQGKGLQNLYRRFDSAPRLQLFREKVGFGRWVTTVKAEAGLTHSQAFLPTKSARLRARLSASCHSVQAAQCTRRRSASGATSRRGSLPVSLESP